ncbi:MAG: bacillithiol system redox-active protein YtxJ [Saprospiraceae bacterium]|nr:bacillithiol system redox-active protein YtxJ [Saprospiraceae bacterium]MCF8248486.1 bacillithiol system redox-active protein YtxJ [Saprospiraceae bacterium]MCF8280557.1 bacillithiol system redox-active protein YtxJ [Bacteroidales bacterium]MCF8310220.1 bacillithiol system redox-active protein YtxJ [Saprospiraceae bacterium]MCF8439341.1 bacillithiol system redox-active protein YtxJ [Saprospiraceae bacterium]
MTWNPLTSTAEIDAIIERSNQVPCLIFKHSTRCSISFMAKHRLEGTWDFSVSHIEPFYLDLIEHRNISNEIAQRFEVYHESPQILLIKNGECILDASHLDISVDEIKEVLHHPVNS